MLRATPRLSWSSSKRRIPRNTSRMISSVQRSPTISSARAIEQFWPSYSLFSMPEAYQCQLRYATHSGIVPLPEFLHATSEGRDGGSGDRDAATHAVEPRCLPARRGRDRARAVRVDHAHTALRHLQRARALLSAYVDADLCDLCLRRARDAPARGRGVRPSRSAAGPARGARGADGSEPPLPVRGLRRLAVRRPRPSGARDRCGLERGEREPARPPPPP